MSSAGRDAIIVAVEQGTPVQVSVPGTAVSVGVPSGVSAVPLLLGEFGTTTLLMGIQGPPGAGLNINRDALEVVFGEVVRQRIAQPTPKVLESDVISEESLNRQKRVLDEKVQALADALAVLISEAAK